MTTVPAPAGTAALRGSGGPVIRLHHVTKRFGSTVAVDDVSLEVRPGRCLAWLGPNGSGKTTLIRMMLGLARPTSGRVELRGFAVPDDLGPALSRVGGIVEEPRFHPYLTGRANLEVWAAHLGAPARRRVGPVLERVGLADRAGDRVKGYSLGMRQRLGVARALLNDPELLVLDEPTNGLDPAGTVEFRVMIRSLVDEGRTVFISSHILGEVQKMADDVAVVQHGRVLAMGSVEQILAGGRTGVVVRVDDPGRAVAVLTATPDVAGVQTAPDHSLRIALSGPVDADGLRALLIDLNRSLVRAGVGVAEIRPEVESLEDRFLHLTGPAAAVTTTRQEARS